MTRKPCSSGYKCRTCGERFTIGPDGAWWWYCQSMIQESGILTRCGGLVEPMTRAEAEAVPSLFDENRSAVNPEVPTEVR